jgi:signal transduction histidine kinase
MRFDAVPVVGPPSLVDEPRVVTSRPARTSRDVRAARLQADARARYGSYVDQVEPQATPLARLQQWFRDLDPWALDAALGTVFTVFGLVGLFGTSDANHVYRDPDALGVALALGVSLPFYVRRRVPFASLVVASAAAVLMLTLEYPASLQTQMLLVSAYTIGAHAEGTKRAAGFVVVELGVAITAAVGIPDSSTANILVAGALYAAAFFFGIAMQNRRLFIEQTAQREALLEREHDEQARRAVADERLRIAQELHDVVAHSMGVIAVQAGVGAHVIDTDPAEAKRSLDAISATSRGTLTEIRRLLGVLRADDRAGYQPAPGLADLDRLVADLDAAGLPVSVHVDGGRHDVPPGVDLTAYRIVQEALTNVLKHAGTASATVTVGYEPGAVRLEIVDDGRGVNGRASGGGHGLVGMRERVGVYGGTLEAGPVPGGGFRVRAHLPYGNGE